MKTLLKKNKTKIHYTEDSRKSPRACFCQRVEFNNRKKR